MRTSLKEWSLVSVTILLLGVFLFLHLKEDDPKDEKQLRNGLIDADTESVNTHRTPHTKILKSKKRHRGNQKDYNGSKMEITECRVHPSESTNFESTDYSIAESEDEDEVVDLLTELGIHAEEVDDVVAAMFEQSKNSEIQEEVWDVEEESIYAQQELEENIYDDLMDSGISVDEIEMVLAMVVSGSEPEEIDGGFPQEEDDSILIEDESEQGMPIPMDESNTPRQVMDDFEEKMYMEDAGFETEDEFSQGDNGIVSLSEEEVEAIIVDFQNFAMSIEEIDRPSENTSTEDEIEEGAE